MTLIPIVIGAPGAATKGLLQGLEEMEKRPSKQQHCWDQSEYKEEFRRLDETCCHSDSCEKQSANAGVKNSKWFE